MKDKALKASIIAEYLTAGLSYRQVAEKRGVDYRSLHRWVKQYQGRMKKTSPVKGIKPHPDLSLEEPLPTEVKLITAGPTKES